MIGLPVVDWTTVVISVLLAFVSTMLATEYRIRRERSVAESAELSEWYVDAAGYVAEVTRTWRRLYHDTDGPADRNEIQSRLSLLESQISRHASYGEQLGVDEEAVEKADALATECRRLSEHRLSISSGGGFEDKGKRCVSTAEELQESIESRDK